MTRRLRLTKDAGLRLEDIGEWTEERFGPAQSERYISEIVARCDAIARGDAPSRDCARIAADAYGLRMTRCGGHFIIFMPFDDAVVVLDFIPASADLPSWLAKLDPPET